MRAWLSLLFSALFAANVNAADNAERAIIGFSPDGRYFAFEQYGVEDGSGFPYSEIFMVDLDANAWVKGSPFRVRLDNEEARLSAARAKAARDASELLAKHKIAEPGEILASQSPTEEARDRHRLSFDPFYMSTAPQPGDSYSLSLKLLPFPAPEACYADEGKQRGFALTISRKENGASKEVYRDAAIPSSRYCPNNYDIADVIAYRAYPSADRHVALIGVYMLGFEGYNRRLIAVPFSLP